MYFHFGSKPGAGVLMMLSLRPLQALAQSINHWVRARKHGLLKSYEAVSHRCPLHVNAIPDTGKLILSLTVRR